MSNRLSKETSPYLLQHAGNPVDWYPWGEEALQTARAENKLILVSIGYSACHWCHVMEHESFEDQEVAQIMNEHFICIKVDREERPDVDQVYMLAVQLMTGQGGWPLNCICLPDQRPIYGGTYFRKHDWVNVLRQLASFWKQKPQEAEEYAVRLTQGVRETEKLHLSDQTPQYSRNDLDDILRPWKKTFDLQEGGYNRAPKFPLPNNWRLMLMLGQLSGEDDVIGATMLTLSKMAYGGIFDHIGGGFSRYSVDGFWHVPHFEKMLYDNAQLVSLYSEAYQYNKDDLFKRVVFQTLSWIKREMTSSEGAFFSALDADSEGIEGRFYTFSKSELIDLLGDEDAEVFSAFYGVTEEGNWTEERTNILIREGGPPRGQADVLNNGDFQTKIDEIRKKVFDYREKRIRPGLDNKILAAWNGLMIKGYTDAYRAFAEPEFLKSALSNAEFISSRMMSPSGRLQRVYKPMETGIPGKDVAFLDDYAFVCEAFISLYEVTFNEQWLIQARTLAEYVLENFYDPGTGMFYYTSQHDAELIARKHEILDNVIPASNSVMAHNLFRLGNFFQHEEYLEQANLMLANVFPQIKTYGSGYSNWAMLLLYKYYGIYEVVITGPEADQKRREIEKKYIPNKIILGGNSGILPLLQDKWVGETKIFVCKNRTCRLPVTDVAEALKLIEY